MRILIIGGTGFIGGAAVRDLARSGNDVFLFHRGEHPPGVPVTGEIRGDRRRLRDFAGELRRIHADVVLDTILANERQAVELVEAIGDSAGRIVALSSGDVYRACGILHGTEPGEPDNTPITEESPLRMRLHPYPPAMVRALAKQFGWLEDDYDKIPAERTVMSGRVPATVLRLPMVYGPGDPLRRLFPMVKRMSDGRKTILLPETIASWRGPRAFVDNVARAIVMAVADQRASGRIYNVAEPGNYSELEWTRRVASAAGWNGEIALIADRRAPPHLLPPGNYRQHWVVESARIRRELGYEEPAPLDEALRRTVEWERANPPAHFDPALFNYAAEDAALAGG